MLKRFPMTRGALAMVVAGLALTPASAAAQSYVALGDSYTSAPLVLPFASGAPLDCLQSGINYPHLTAKALSLSLRDVSCSGASVGDMTSAQHSDQPPQFDALSQSTNVVTFSIGGNDNGTFSTAAVGCFEADIFDFLNRGAPCQSKYGNTFANQIASDGPRIGNALAQIHALSPNAKVFVVGYPDVLPQSGNCYPQVPLTTGDVSYLNGVEHDLNSMLASEASSHDATYVDTFTPSIGHDACKSESRRWVEPPIPSSLAAPVHPNAAGEAADAQDVEAAFSAANVGQSIRHTSRRVAARNRRHNRRHHHRH